MNDEIKNMIEKLVNEQKKENLSYNKFLGNILMEVSEFNFNKLNNLAIVFVGILSPIIPITFLFRKDIVDGMNIIPLLIITITINTIILILGTIFYRISLISELDAYKSRILKLNIKIEMKITKVDKNVCKVEKQNNNAIIKNNILHLIKYKLWRIERLNIKLKKLVLKYEIKDKEVNGERYKLEEKKIENIEIKKKESSKDFMCVVIMNTVIGAMVVLLKSITYFGVISINFKFILATTLMIYGVFILKFVPCMFIEEYNNKMIKIYEKIMVKKIKLKNNNYEQINMFKEIEL